MVTGVYDGRPQAGRPALGDGIVPHLDVICQGTGLLRCVAPRSSSRDHPSGADVAKVRSFQAVQATEDAQASCLPAWHHPQRSPFSPSASPTQQQQHQTAAPLRPSATELLVMPGLGPIGSAPTNMLATGSLESVAPDVPSKQPFSRSMSAIDLQPSSMAGGERMRAGRGSKVATSYDFEGKVHGGVYKSASYRSSSALLEEWGGPSSAGSLADGSGQAWAAWGPQGLPLVSGSCASSHGSSLNQLPPPLATQSSDKLGTPSPSKQAARSEQGPHTPCGASAAGSAMDAGEDPQQPRTGCATLQGGCQGGVAAQPSQDACQEVGRVADCRAVPACEAAQGSSQGAPAACKVGASTQGAQAQAAAAAEEEEKEREEQRLQALLLGSAASSYSSSSGGGRACSLEGVHGTLLMAVAEEEGEAAGGMCASDTHVVGSSSAQEQQQQQQQQQQHEGQLQPLQSSASCPAHAKLNRNSSSSKSRHSCGLPLGEASWARDVFAGAITYSSCGSGLSLLEFADGSSSRSLGAWANKSLPQSPCSGLYKVRPGGSSEVLEVTQSSSLQGTSSLAHTASLDTPCSLPSAQQSLSILRSSSGVAAHRQAPPAVHLAHSMSMPHAPSGSALLSPHSPHRVPPSMSPSYNSLLEFAEASIQSRKLGSGAAWPMAYQAGSSRSSSDELQGGLVRERVERAVQAQ